MILSCTTLSTSAALRNALNRARACTPAGASTTKPFGRRLLLLLLLLLLLAVGDMPTDAAAMIVLRVSLPSSALMWKGISGAAAAAAAAAVVVEIEAMPTLAPLLLEAAAARASLPDTCLCNLLDSAETHTYNSGQEQLLWFCIRQLCKTISLLLLLLLLVACMLLF
jgi:hypothetical protein